MAAAKQRAHWLRSIVERVSYPSLIAVKNPPKVARASYLTHSRSANQPNAATGLVVAENHGTGAQSPLNAVGTCSRAL